MQRIFEQQQISTAAYIATDVGQQLDERLRSLESIAEIVTPAILGKTLLLQGLLEQRPLLQRLFNGGVIVYRRDGTAIAEVPRSAGSVGTNYGGIDTVAAALQDGKASIGRPVIGKKLLAPVFGMTVPIRDPQGAVIGALAGVMNLGLPSFLDIIAKSSYGTTGGYLLVSPQHGLIIAASDQRSIMQSLPASGALPLLEHFVDGYEGTQILLDSLGAEVLVSVKSVPVAGWYMAVAMPTAEAFAPIHSLQQRMLTATILLSLLAGGLTWCMLRRQLLPMHAALQAVAKMSVGDDPMYPLPFTGEDEIARLAGAFNNLLRIAEQREAALRASEMRFRQLLQNIPFVSVQGYARDGTTHYWNSASERLYGFSAEEAIGRNLLDLIVPPDLHQSARDAMRLTFETAQPVPPKELSLMRKDGSRVEVVSSHAYVHVHGNAPEMFCVHVDLTERKRMEDELRQREQLASPATLTRASISKSN